MINAGYKQGVTTAAAPPPGGIPVSWYDQLGTAGVGQQAGDVYFSGLLGPATGIPETGNQMMANQDDLGLLPNINRTIPNAGYPEMDNIDALSHYDSMNPVPMLEAQRTKFNLGTTMFFTLSRNSPTVLAGLLSPSDLISYVPRNAAMAIARTGLDMGCNDVNNVKFPNDPGTLPDNIDGIDILSLAIGGIVADAFTLDALSPSLSINGGTIGLRDPDGGGPLPQGIWATLFGNGDVPCQFSGPADLLTTDDPVGTGNGDPEFAVMGDFFGFISGFSHYVMATGGTGMPPGGDPVPGAPVDEVDAFDTVIPEPATMLVMGAGFAGLAALRRRRR
jgi:hypothetical protein